MPEGFNTKNVIDKMKYLVANQKPEENLKIFYYGPNLREPEMVSFNNLKTEAIVYLNILEGTITITAPDRCTHI